MFLVSLVLPLVLKGAERGKHVGLMVKACNKPVSEVELFQMITGKHPCIMELVL